MERMCSDKIVQHQDEVKMMFLTFTAVVSTVNYVHNHAIYIAGYLYFTFTNIVFQSIV